jgi:plasmid maintenance system antidote protein VapI
VRNSRFKEEQIIAILKESEAGVETALRLAHFFGTTAEFWLNLQSLYDLRIAQKKAGKSIRRLPTLKQGQKLHA